MEVTWRIFRRVQSCWKAEAKRRAALNSGPEGSTKPCGWKQAWTLPVMGRESWRLGVGSLTLPQEPATDSSPGERGMGDPPSGLLLHLPPASVEPQTPIVQSGELKSKAVWPCRYAAMFAPRPTAPSLIPRAVLSQIPRGMPPFPPFLPPLGAARKPARTSPRRAPTGARPLLGPLSPVPATTVRETRPRSAVCPQLPFLAAPRACGRAGC